MKKHLKTTQNFTIENKPNTYFYIKKQELGTFTDFAQAGIRQEQDRWEYCCSYFWCLFSHGSNFCFNCFLKSVQKGKA